MSEHKQPYVHALRYPWLTKFYDAVVRATLPERSLKGLLCDHVAADLPPGGAVLDLGCGTGTLTLLLKERLSGGTVTGLDGDPEVLNQAREKATEAGIDVNWLEGDATAPPFEPATFDRVASSLLFHHLPPEGKRTALASVRTLLKPGGRLHLLDWGRPHGPAMRLAFIPVQLLDGFATTQENVRGLLPALMKEAGFVDVAEVARRRTMFGTLSVYQGSAE